MRVQLRNLIAIVMSLLCLTGCRNNGDTTGGHFSRDQQLVMAAYDLDAAKVSALLSQGANPNSRLGLYDEALFEDKWTLGFSPIGSDRWTPLMAVASNTREPQPAMRAQNSSEGLEIAQKQRASVDPRLILDRDRRRIEIARTLIKAKADLDLDDGHGSTALAEAVYLGYEDLALLLIEAGANIETKTGVYIDGTGDITPLHRATGSPTVLAAMLKRSPRVDVKDDAGETPLHWAVRDGNAASVKLLLNSGADPTVTNRAGHTPAYWCITYDDVELLGAADKKRISKLLKDANSKKRTGAIFP